MCAMGLVGPEAVPNEIEQAMFKPSLERIIARTPLATVERASGLLDPAMLLAAMALYLRRVSLMVGQRPRVAAATQVTDTAAPANIAPPTTTVETMRHGDVDGIATPVPDVIRQGFLTE